MYIPFNIKTDYSLMYSMIKIKDLVKYAVDHNIKALTITDDNLFGAIEFYDECIKNNIKPIIGLNIKQDDLDIILYALNYNGYQELLKISTIYREKKIASLNKSNNLLCIIPYESRSLYKELSLKYKEIYVSYKNEEQKNKIKLSNKLYMNEILYLEKNDEEVYKYFRSYKQNLQLVEYNNDLKLNVENNSYLYDKFDLEIFKNESLLPDIKDAQIKLKEECKKGLKNRFGEKVYQKYIDRLKQELDVINQMGFASYFLIVSDYVKFAKNNNIMVGPGRGSAVGSLVSYVLGITNIDPLKYDLLFERFLNPKRITMPDIDIDFDAAKREEVIKYCINKYGEKNVAGVVTFATISIKQAIKELGILLEIDNSDINYLINLVDLNKLDSLDNLKELNKLYQMAKKIEGLKTNLSVNASGIVICKNELDNYVPLERHNDMYLVGHTMNYLEELGLLKMDFLALKNLTTISYIAKEANIDINNIPLNDQKTFDIFNKCNTSGIFQFETETMKDILGKFKITSFDDIYNLSALARPGAKDSIDTYIKRKNGQEKYDYMHPDLESVLKPTYGIIIYQEQIMQIARILADYSLGEADLLRRAMSKKKEEILKQEKSKFIERAVSKGYDKNLVIKIYNYILKFAEYGFNKSHSVAYAYISYQMAYLKAHYKEIFMVSLFKQIEGSKSSVKECISECRLNNIKLYTPNIENASTEFKINNGIILPLTLIEDVNITVASNIVNNLVDDFYAFLSNLDIKLVNKKVFTNLVKIGFFDSFYNRQTLLKNLDAIYNYIEVYKELGVTNKPVIEEYPEYSQKELSQMEYEVMGFYVNYNPIVTYRSELKKEKSLSVLSSYLNRKIEVIAIIDKKHETRTKDNKKMCFVTLSDTYSSVEGVIFNDSYENLVFNENDIVLLYGKVATRNGKYQIIIEKLKVLEGGK